MSSAVYLRASAALCQSPTRLAVYFSEPPDHPLHKRAGGDDLVAVGGGVGEGVFDDGLADVAVAQRVRHVGAGEIEGPGARHCVGEGGFLAADGGEEPAAAGVVADVEFHGVTCAPSRLVPEPHGSIADKGFRAASRALSGPRAKPAEDAY